MGNRARGLVKPRKLLVGKKRGTEKNRSKPSGLCSLLGGRKKEELLKGKEGKQTDLKVRRN